MVLAGPVRCFPLPCYTERMTREQVRRSFPFGIILGVAVGIALGIARSNMAIGIGVGAGLAIVFGVAFDRKDRSAS